MLSYKTMCGYGSSLDFVAVANNKVFQSPFNGDMETVAPELQMEAIDLQSSQICKVTYSKTS